MNNDNMEYDMRHKHHKVIKAWADGAVIEGNDGYGWFEPKDPRFFNHIEYRVKPAEPVYEWQWAYYTREFLTWIVTDCHMTKSSAEDFFRGRHIHERIEGSKREVEL